MMPVIEALMDEYKWAQSCMESGNEFPDFSVCSGDITISIKAIQNDAKLSSNFMHH